MDDEDIKNLSTTDDGKIALVRLVAQGYGVYNDPDRAKVQRIVLNAANQDGAKRYYIDHPGDWLRYSDEPGGKGKPRGRRGPNTYLEWYAFDVLHSALQKRVITPDRYWEELNRLADRATSAGLLYERPDVMYSKSIPGLSLEQSALLKKKLVTKMRSNTKRFYEKVRKQH